MDQLKSSGEDYWDKVAEETSAHVCSEIGVKWFLFLKHSQNTLIKQIHNESTYAKMDLKPFLTILGTRMRAKYFKYWSINAQLLTNYSSKSCFFIEEMKLKKAKYSLSNVEDLSTFIIIDDEQLLLLIGRNGKK